MSFTALNALERSFHFSSWLRISLFPVSSSLPLHWHIIMHWLSIFVLLKVKDLAILPFFQVGQNTRFFSIEWAPIFLGQKDESFPFYLTSRGKEKIEQLPCERFLQGFGFSRALLPPVSHGEKSGEFQKPVKMLTRHFSFTLIFFTCALKVR